MECVQISKRKIVIPAVWPKAIVRSRLQARLYEAVCDHQHVLIVGGAGFGKTSLLAAFWAPRRVAWVSLDTEDLDSELLLRAVLASVQARFPSFHVDAVQDVLRLRDPQAVRRAVEVFIEEVDEQICDPFGLVLENYHEAESPTANAFIGDLIGFLPPTITLMLTTRRMPDMDVRRFIMQRRLCLLSEPELAFDLEELRLQQPAKSNQDLADLQQSTGGWPAAMGLPPSHRDDYLEKQFLAGRSEAARAFLVRAAQLDAFPLDAAGPAFDMPLTGPLRDELVRHGLLRELEERHYEVPEPLRGMLRRGFDAELEARARVALLERVAEYQRQAGQNLQALRTWLRAGHQARAAEHLLSIGPGWLSAGRLDAMAGALTMIGRFEGLPEFAVLEGEVFRRLGNFDRAEACLERAYSAYQARADAQGMAKARLRQAMVLASCGKVGQAGQVLPEARWAMDADDRLALDLLNTEAGVALSGGHVPEAVERFEQSLHLARRIGDRYCEARAAHNLGVCHTRMGDLVQALGAYDSVMFASEGGPLFWMTPINRALVLVMLGRCAEGRVAALEALSAVRVCKLTREEGYALRTLGHASVELGDLEQALACFEASIGLARRTSDAMGLAVSLNYRADLAGRMGDLEGADALFREAWDLCRGDASGFQSPEFSYVRARIHLEAGRTAEAQAVVSEALREAEAQGFKYWRYALVLLAARIARDRAESGAAERWETIYQTLARANGYPDLNRHIDAQRPAPSIKVQCFGGFRVWRQDGEVKDKELQTAKAKLVCVFLLLHPGGASKSQILDAIYGGEVVSNPTFNMNLVRLRKALEPGLAEGKASRYVLRADGRYSLNFQSGIESDIHAFDRELASGADRATRLRRALDRYTGEFLPEFETDWIVLERQAYRAKALDACRQLLDLAEGDESECLRLIRRALEISPLSEEFNRELILRLLEAGEGYQAVEHFNLCQLRFRTIGMEPPEDLAELVNSAGI